MRALLLYFAAACAACNSPPSPAAPPCPPCDCKTAAAVAPPEASIVVAQPLDLPKPSMGGDQQAFVAVDVSAAGECSVDGKAVGACDNILAPAKEAAAKNPDIRAVIRADKDARHAVVVRAIDVLKQAGISKVAFAVSAPAAPAP